MRKVKGNGIKSKVKIMNKSKEMKMDKSKCGKQDLCVTERKRDKNEWKKRDVGKVKRNRTNRRVKGFRTNV